jgi:WD40 repeat protein
VVLNVVFSPDGKTLAASGGDEAIVLWKLDSLQGQGQYLRAPDTSIGEFNGLLDNSVPLAFAPNNSTLFSGQPDGSVTSWDLQHPKNHRTFRGQNSPVTSLAFDPDGEVLLSGTATGNIAVRDPAGQDPLVPTLKGPIKALQTVAVSPDGQLVAAGGCDPASLHVEGEGGLVCSAGVVAIWDMSRSGRGGASSPRLLRGHSDFVHAIIFSLDGATLISGGGDGKVFRWNLRDGSRQLLVEHQHEVMSIALAADGQSVASANFYGGVVTYDLATGKKSVVQPEQTEANSTMPIPVTSLAYALDGRRLAVGHDNGELAVWDLRKAQRKTLPLQAERVMSVAASPDGATLASVDSSGKIQRWDMRTDERIGEPILDRGSEGSLAFSPNGELLASASQAGAILWDLETEQPIGRPFPNERWTDSVAFNTLADRPVLVSAGGDDTVRRWEIDPNIWAAWACARANRDLTRQEWNRFIGAEVPYRSTC